MKYNESKYWADQIAQKVIREFPKEKLYTVAAGITPSGTIHIGNFREIITVDLIYRAIKDMGKNVRFIYSWDDYDRIRRVPKNIPNQKAFEKYMYMPGIDAPDPWGCHKSYTEHFEKEVIEDLPRVGIAPQYIYQNKMYRGRKYAEDIKQLLDKRFGIRAVLNRYRREPLPENWFGVSIYCDKCNREQTEITEWDGQYTLKYSCNACSHKGETNFKKKGNVKLPWRTDWPMRWLYENVSCEGGGKDHSSPGAGLDTGHAICREVFNKTPPIRFFYDFITIKGQQGRMSGSRGDVMSLREVLAVYTPELVRYIFAGTKPQTEFKLSFDEDIFKVYDDFYACERIYFDQKKVNDRDRAHWSRVYEMSMVSKPPRSMPIQPNFKHCAELITIYRDPKEALEAVCVNEKITKKQDKDRYLTILICAKNWLAKYAPEQYKFELQESPNSAGLSTAQKNALNQLVSVLKKPVKDSKSLYLEFRTIAENNKITIREFFIACYKILANKEIGPRLSPFIIAVGKNKIAALITKGLKNTKEVKETKEKITGYKPIKDVFEIQKETLEKFPGLKVGIAIISGLKVKKQTPELEKLKKDTVDALIKEFKDKDLNDIPVLQEYKRIYRATGVDPSKRKPSPLALLQRVKKGQELYTVNNLVDVYNLAVMKTQVSMGAFDMKNINFPTYLRFSKKDEEFTALMADKPKKIDAGELVYADKKGLIICRDLNYRDSDFTKITDKTKDTILYVDGTVVTSEKEVKEAMKLAVKWILKYCGGKLEKIAYTF